MDNHQVPPAKQRVLGFLDTEIQGFVVGDLARLGTLSPAGSKPFTCQCTVPESLAAFAALELMGFLMRSDFNEERNLDMPALIKLQAACGEATGADADALGTLGGRTRIDDTSGNIEYMVEKWLNLESGSQYDKFTIQVLISLFRHGGAHRYFPKAAAIRRGGSAFPVLDFEKESGFSVPILNEDRLREDYLAANKRITAIIRNNDEEQLRSITGETVGVLVGRMSARLDVLLYLDRRKLKNILAEFKRTDLLPCRTSSGASGAGEPSDPYQSPALKTSVHSGHSMLNS
ncbi:MAG: hypothetical protein AB1473_00775 [Thermodesulfobacteriota bacterium]